MTKRSLTSRLLIAAVLLNWIPGTLVNRALVETPAWRVLGAQAWADFSRHADLGPGIAAYAAGGGVVWVLIIAAAIAYRFDRSAPRSAALPVYLAVLSTLGMIASTVVAAPVMLGVDRLTDPSDVQHAFDTFTLWGVYVRGVFSVLTFAFSVWALVRTLHPRQPVTADR
jgi:hypothetical protein